MKKIGIILLILVLFLSLSIKVDAKKLDIDVPNVTEHEKVKIYLFRGEKCAHCFDFLSYFNEHMKQFKDYFEIVAYETYKDAKNLELKNKVNDFLEITDEKERGSVPLIVIGSWHILGFAEDNGPEIINKALEYYQDDSYVDEVANIIKENNLENNPETLNEACTKEGIKVNNEYSNAIALGVILLVLVGGFASIIFISKK